MRDFFQHFRRGVAAEWIAAAMLAGVFAIWSFVPAWRTLRTDFPNYYLAASLYSRGIPLDRVYEWRWFQRQKDHLQIDQRLVGFAPHPPMCALPVLPLASLPPLTAKRVWLILNLAFLALALWLFRRTTDLPWRRLLLLCFLCLLPLRQNFLFGQYYVLILLLLCAGYFAAGRGWKFASGAWLAVAASLKIFPAFFLILFLRKRDWRAAAGLVLTGVALAAISVLLFGWNVHKIFLLEILPRAMHGDLVGPYALEWNSFTGLCHRFLLAEPELNPAPWINSIAAYSIVQAALATFFLFAFLLSTGESETRETQAWEWSTFLALLVVLSSMPTAYHHCVLIFTVIVGVDFLLKRGRHGSAVMLVMFFALACAPMPRFIWLNLQSRLVGDLLIVFLLLLEAPGRASRRVLRFGYAMALVFFAFLTFSNLRALHSRDEDFSRRVPVAIEGYGTLAVSSGGDRLFLDELMTNGYGAVAVPGGVLQPPSANQDVLAVSAAPESVYLEIAGERSRIVRVPATNGGQSGVSDEVADGYDPVVSPDGHWLAYLTDAGGKTEIHGMKDGHRLPLSYSERTGDILEMSFSSDGSLIFASGGAADPHLMLWGYSSGAARRLSEIQGAVRFPALSPDGRWLALSRRESGSWHLFLHDLQNGEEVRFTSGACNAISPSWENSHALVYVSDCGRDLGLGAPVRLDLSKLELSKPELSK
ncbi:MAG TPA: glycosyltransferase 87 family protein [Candidatus Sulfotelmatobacter sp.]|jgi:hypothetical protein